MQANAFDRIRKAASPYFPGPRAWQGAGIGLLALSIDWVAWDAAFVLVVPAPNLYELAGLALNLANYGLAAFLLVQLVRSIFRNASRLFIWALAMALILAYSSVPMVFAGGGFLTILYFLAAAALAGAGAWVIARRGLPGLTPLRRRITWGGLGAGLAMLACGVFWLAGDGTAPPRPVDASAGASPLQLALDLPDPSLPGAYPVGSLTYGSGTDLRRPEYGAGVALVSAPVDGSALVAGWSGYSGWLRTRYWGFDAAHLPLNGRVWFPQGPGPFPLVLAVHGNHTMEGFSDPGYGYLGELLASRGFIFVSIDLNYLTLSSFHDYIGPFPTGLTRVSDARAWLVLEHLRLWRGWNGAPGNPFSGKVDLARIALIGHSRGGETVAVAAMLNRLSPADERIPGDYDFGIRTVIGIAPIAQATFLDGREARLQDVDYFVMQGMHDGELNRFQGLNQYERVAWSGGDHFKAALFIYGANHAQFNTAWGRRDLRATFWPFWNMAQVMPAADQQQIARVYVSAMLEASLHREAGYRALFRDARTAAAWLPESIYLGRYAASTMDLLCDYQEDAGPRVTTRHGGAISGAGLAAWREEKLPSQANRAVWLAWDSTAARYSLDIAPGGPALTPQSVLVFQLAGAGEDTGAAVDLTIEAVDRSGTVARLPLSAFAALQPPVAVNLYKTGLLMGMPARSEPFLASFEFPLAAFSAAHPGFDPAGLASLHFVFDRTPRGAVYLDNPGFDP